MKFFNSIHKSFENVGIHWHQSSELRSVNLKNSIIITTLAISSILSAMFLMFEAKTFGEYFESFYTTVTLIQDFMVVSEFVRKTFKTKAFFMNLEKTIEKREYLKLIFVSKLVTENGHRKGSVTITFYE